MTITGDTQGVFGVLELLTRGYQLVSRKLYCWLVIGGGASYHQVGFIVVLSGGRESVTISLVLLLTLALSSKKIYTNIYTTPTSPNSPYDRSCV